jgi:hypothetical protein
VASQERLNSMDSVSCLVEQSHQYTVSPAAMQRYGNGHICGLRNGIRLWFYRNKSNNSGAYDST